VIEAGSIGEKDARLLEIKANSPILVATRLTYLENMQLRKTAAIICIRAVWGV